MDTRSRTASRTAAATLTLAACIVFFGPTARSDSEPAPLAVHGGNVGQQQAVEWALRRFREAGLPALPPLEVYLHRNGQGCGGDMGFYRDGRIDLCTSQSSERYGRKFALHELAHAWTEAHLDGELEVRFMRLRAVEAWNDGSLEWKERGFEQAAEIIAWGLGEGEIQPLLPEREDARVLAESFELLTGGEPINGLA